MDRMIDTVRALREQLQQLEAALAMGGALTEPAWIDFEGDSQGDGAVIALSPAAVSQFDLDPQTSVGVPLAALIDVEGDLFADTFLCVRTGVERVPALRIPGARRGPARTPERILFGRAGTMPAAIPSARRPQGNEAEGRSPAAAEREQQFRHDLANIHGIIRGHAELLAMEIDTERVTRATREILEAVRRAQQMIAERRSD